MDLLVLMLVPVLAAAACGALGLWIGQQAVTWYGISSFEGGSGYYVVAICIGGLLLGVLASIAAAAVARFALRLELWPTAALSLFTPIALALLIGGVMRLNAHLPPKLDGRDVELEVELRVSGLTAPPTRIADTPPLRLLAFSGRRQLRFSQDGDLALDAARQEGDLWLITGRVGLPTTRGNCIISLRFSDIDYGLQVPFPSLGRLPASLRQWGDWFPRAMPANRPDLARVQFRYRLRPIAD